MQTTFLLSLVFVVGFLACILWVAIRAKSMPTSHRDEQRGFRIAMYVVLTVGFLFIVVHVLLYGKLETSELLSAMILLSWAWMFGGHGYRKPTDIEAQKNYACDQRYCGQCGYDLTGNVSGICPECGWGIPEKPIQLARADWALWWRKWTIDYLPNWRTELIMLAVLGMLILLLSVVLWETDTLWPFILIPWLLVPHCAINVIRLIAYARRLRAQHFSEE